MPDPEKVRNWMINYYESPKAKERLVRSKYNDPEHEIAKRTATVKKTKVVNEENWRGSNYNGLKNEIQYSPEKDKEQRNVFKNDVLGTIDNEGTLAHEFTHAALRGERINNRDRNELSRRVIPEARKGKTKVLNASHGYPEKQVKAPPEHRGIEENLSDINAMRYKLKEQGIYDAGSEDFTKEHLDKMENTEFKERALKTYKEDDLIWLMNNVANKNKKQTKYINDSKDLTLA